jgi:hypothetical protein
MDGGTQAAFIVTRNLEGLRTITPAQTMKLSPLFQVHSNSPSKYQLNNALHLDRKKRIQLTVYAARYHPLLIVHLVVIPM